MGWLEIGYEFDFLWQGQSIFNKAITKTENSGLFFAEDDDSSGIIDLLNQVLKSDKADYWEFIAEPYLMIAIYPDDFFPFLPSHSQKIYESDGMRKQREARALLKEEKGQLPDDCYTLIARLDSIQFENSKFYTGDGIALHLTVYRQDLERFAKELEKEYMALLEKEGLR